MQTENGNNGNGNDIGLVIIFHTRAEFGIKEDFLQQVRIRSGSFNVWVRGSRALTNCMVLESLLCFQSSKVGKQIYQVARHLGLTLIESQGDYVQKWGVYEAQFLEVK